MATYIATDSFLPLILPWAQGAPHLAVSSEIVRAAVKFCELTGAWVETMTPITVVSGTHTYTIPAPSQGQVVHIRSLHYDDFPLLHRAPEELDMERLSWRTDEGKPRWYTQFASTKIRLIPIPDENLTDGLTGEITCKPEMTATQIPDFLFNQYGFGVAAGALASLLSMPNRAWTNPNLAVFYLRQFDSALAAAKIDAAKAFGKAERQVRMRFV